LWGEQSYNTALEIANTAFTSTDTVVLARYNDFQDAMSATGLAGATNAAILLTEQDKLSDGVEAEIQSLGAKTVYIIGGEAAVKPEVQTKVGTIPGVSSVKRISGNEAWDTSVECAKELKAVQKQSGTTPEKNYAAVAMSTNFQDALSLSSFAYKYQVPIFLETYDKQMPDNVKEMLTGSGDYAASDIYIPGGPGAVPFNTVEDALGQRTYVRMYGENGYDTSNEIAKYLVNNKLLSASYVCVASGAQVAKGTDALAGAALAGKNSGVMLLINDKESFEDVNTKTIDKFLTSNASSVGSTYVLGGTGVISDDTRNRISTILGGA
jgi:lactocepin